MISAIMALMVGTLLSLAAWATAQSDITFTDKDKWSRLAYQRAQSGVTDYVQRLAEDPGFWKYCDTPDGITGEGIGQTALNDTDIGAAGHSKRRWLPMSATPGSTDDLAYNTQYTIDLVPVAPATACKPLADAGKNMINPETGTFRIAVTGRAGPLVPANLTGTAIEDWRQKNWTRVTLAAEFKRNGFLDYAYFTDHEGVDPAIQSVGANQCIGYYQDDPNYDSADGDRATAPLRGRWRNTSCTELRFVDEDAIDGPVHTNDSILLESTTGARFGSHGKGDRIEVYDNGKSNNAGKGLCPFRTGAATMPTPPSVALPSRCSTNANRGSGTSIVTGPAAGYLDLPQENEDLTLYSDPASGDPDSQGLRYYGRTSIVLRGDGTFNVKDDVTTGGAWQNGVSYPTSGVIYVYDTVANCQSFPNKEYNLSLPVGCARTEVSGSYNKSLTIGSQSDIVVTGNIDRTNSQSAVLGLIANQYVRVRHYSNSGSNNYLNASGSCRSDGVTGTDVSYIRAAILTLNKSFTVDAYVCGAKLNNVSPTPVAMRGQLTVDGAIAQRWRGGVGSGSSGSGTCPVNTGYCKDYNYDYTLKSQTPPHFLSPLAASWKVIRQRRTLPACLCKSTP